jgi:hypothetical protein
LNLGTHCCPKTRPCRVSKSSNIGPGALPKNPARFHLPLLGLYELLYRYLLE